MPRKRMIDPEFWIDEKLASVSRDARLLFIGLWNFADDNGNLCHSAMRIKAQVFPYEQDIDNEAIDGLVEELVRIRALILYQIDGKDYLCIRKFPSYQTINRPSESRIPMCPPDLVTSHNVVSEESQHTHAEVKLKEIEEKRRRREGFMEYAEGLRPRFTSLDFNGEFEKFWLYWNEGRRKCKNPKLALLNWMTRALKFRAEREVQQDGKPFHCADCGRGFDTEEEQTQHLWSCKR